MAHTVAPHSRSSITQLREWLDKAERLVVQVDGTTIAEFLTLLDSIDERFEQLEPEVPDLRPEQSRWESLLNRINNKPDTIVRAAAVAGGMEKLRAAHPPAESFWWHLDKEVARRRYNSIRRLLITTVTLVVVILGGYWAINYFFPPNPEAVLMVETTNSIDRLVSEQRWQEALDLVKAARTQAPDQGELIVWEVVLNERIGDSDATAAALAEAEAAYASQPIDMLIHLGNDRLRVGDVEGALTAADQAMAIDSQNPQVYFLLGSIAETQGDLAAAIDYFDKTFTLAEGVNPQLAVIARVRMGSLMQNPASFTSPEATPSPTP
ncbi:MAG: tetratricopeptide repeat protein [Caldilineaceae bacterium]|nr:tetratricopeptide repeat protein [Caldilineaceae bacterium]